MVDFLKEFGLILILIGGLLFGVGFYETIHKNSHKNLRMGRKYIVSGIFFGAVGYLTVVWG